MALGESWLISVMMRFSSKRISGVIISAFGRYAIGILTTVVVLSGCGRGQPPIDAPDTMTPTHAALGRSWMLPRAKKDDLLYVTYPSSKSIEVYSYPRAKKVGVIASTATPGLECADKAGNVYVVYDAPTSVEEYAHGGTTPIATFSLPLSGPATSCAVDPTTGNLALTADFYSVGPVLLVYPKGQHRYPQAYEDARVKLFGFCSYDNSGNLFVDGHVAANHSYILAELPQGGSSLENLSLSPKSDLTSAGPVQWDGRFLTLGDYPTNLIYRVAVNSSGVAYIVGSTTLGGIEHIGPFWIQGKSVIGVAQVQKLAFFWRYPAGGYPTGYVSGPTFPLGVTVSLAKR